MKERIISSELLGQTVRVVEHPSGLTVMLCPMEGFATASAMFAARVGSTDTSFRLAGEEEFVDVPEGVAHFLEHKMFECEDGDAFAKYSSTGANANAFTSFDKTNYLFTCTQNFEASLRILLDFVTRPYFTPQTVEKEKGIIGQEIKMYEDNSGWRSMFNLLGIVYKENPVRVDIAGTVESIAQIDDKLLYRCYNTFYNLNNMVLAAAGNIDPDHVLAICDELLKPAIPAKVESRQVSEPRGVTEKEIIQKLPVSIPQFEIGFKGAAGSPLENLNNSIYDEMLLDILCGESTMLYRRLYDSGLINASFGSEVLSGRDYLCCMIGGESRDPRAVRDAVCAEAERMMRDGIDAEAFERARKAAYGRYIGLYCRADSVTGLMISTHFAGEDDIYSPVRTVRNTTAEQLAKRLAEDLDPQYSALSIIQPLDK